jgi:phage FluMu protein Com
MGDVRCECGKLFFRVLPSGEIEIKCRCGDLVIINLDKNKPNLYNKSQIERLERQKFKDSLSKS